MKILITEQQYKRLLEKKITKGSILKEYKNVNIDKLDLLSYEFSNILSELSYLIDLYYEPGDGVVEVIDEKTIHIITKNEKIKDGLIDLIDDTEKFEYTNNVDEGYLEIRFNENYKPEKKVGYFGTELKDFIDYSYDDYDVFKDEDNNTIDDVSDDIYTPSFGNRDFGYREKIEYLCKQGKTKYCTGHNHYGEDYPVKQGTEIYSKMGGRVEYAKITSNNCGGTLNIKMDDGTTSKFCHLSKIFVKTGEKINKNQLIALSGGAKGTTGAGSSTGPHIHYGFKNTDRITVDPVGKEQKYWGVKK